MVRHRSRVPALLRDGGSIPPPAAISLESTGMWIPTGLESRSPARVAVRLGCSQPVPEGAAHGGQLALSTRIRASGVVQFSRLPPTLFQVSLTYYLKQGGRQAESFNSAAFRQLCFKFL